MLTLVAAVLLSSLPTASSLSLLQPAPSFDGRPLSARLLVAQAPTGMQPEPFPATPFPDEGEARPPERTQDDGLDARIQDLTSQVNELQADIDSIRVRRPGGYVVMTVFGFILSPILLISLPILIAGLGESGSTGDALTAIGLVLTVPGAVGVGLLIGGFTGGSRAVSARRAERDALIRERDLVKEELRDLEARRDGLRTQRWQLRPSVPLLAMSF